MTNEIYSQKLFESLHVNLQGILEVDPISGTYEDEIDLSEPWKAVGEVNLYKAKAIHTQYELFVKSFAPRVIQYANAYYAAIQELVQVSSCNPVLPVIGRSNGTFFFRQGTHIDEIYWESLDINERSAMRHIVEKYGLRPLGRFNRLPVIKVGGVAYITDPIDDSVASVYDFIHPNEE